MSKLEKKKKKLAERIKFLEDEMYSNLKQKFSATSEISISDYTTKIALLRKELASIT